MHDGEDFGFPVAVSLLVVKIREEPLHDPVTANPRLRQVGLDLSVDFPLDEQIF